MIKITKVSGYVDTPTPKKCGTCKYLVNGNACRNKTVESDPQVPAGGNGMKRVSAENGCCNEWEPGSATSDRRSRLADMLTKPK